MTLEQGDDVQLFQSIGLSEQKAKETLKNAQVTKNLKVAITEAAKHGAVSPEIGVLLYHLSSKIKSQISEKIGFVAGYIAENKLDTVQRVDAALNYLLSSVKGPICEKDFEEACGIGIVVSPEEIEAEVERVIESHKDEIIEKRYHYNVGPLMQQVRNTLKWADGKAVKNEFDVQLLDLLGPKTDDDLKPVAKQAKQAKPKKQVKDNESTIFTR